MHLGSGAIGKLSRCSLGAPGLPKTVPASRCPLKLAASTRQPQIGGVAYRKHSHSRACRMQALELRGELRTIQQPLGWLQLTEEREACPSDLFLGTLPLERKPDSLAEMSHPPPSLHSLTLYSLELTWHISKR